MMRGVTPLVRSVAAAVTAAVIALGRACGLCSVYMKLHSQLLLCVCMMAARQMRGVI